MLQNPNNTKERIVRWIQEYFNENFPTANAIIGISGGKDSSVAAALCVVALGKKRVIGIMMPNGKHPADKLAVTRLYHLPSPI